jgi:hypothetical protein
VEQEGGTNIQARRHRPTLFREQSSLAASVVAFQISRWIR